MKVIKVSDEVHARLSERSGGTMGDKIDKLLGMIPDWMVKDAEALAEFDGCSVDDALFKIMYNITEPPRMSDDPYFDGWADSSTMVEHMDVSGEPVSLIPISFDKWGVNNYGSQIIYKYLPKGEKK